MNDVNQPDLELRLRDHYRTLEVDSSRDLAFRVAEGLGRAPGRRWPPFRMPRRTAAAAAVGVAALAVLAVLTAPVWFGQATPAGPAASSSSTATVAASGSSSPSPSFALAETPTPTLGPAKCATDPATTSYDLAGWLGTRIVLVADHVSGCSDWHQELLSVDPAVGQWRTDSQLPYPLVTFVGSTDGSSIAMYNADGILIIDAAGKQHEIGRPAGAPEDLGYYGLPVLPGGGYLVTGGDKLYRVASDGSGMTTDPLPAGYVAVAPTSDPNIFILAPTEDANVEYGLSARAPFRAYLWNIRTDHLKLVASSVSMVDRSLDSLAYLSVVDGWASLAADGSTTPVTRPGVLVGWNSPDGSRYIHVPDPTSAEVQTVELRETATGRVLATLQVAIGPVVWKGDVAAMVAGSDLVILDGSTVTRVPLP